MLWLRLSASGVFGLCLLFLGGCASDSHVDDFTVTAFHANYLIGRDDEGRSTLHTTEHITVLFGDDGDHRGIIRTIPNEFDGHFLETTVLEVTDGSGQAIPHEVTYSPSSVSVSLGDDTLVQGEQEYTVSYRQRDVVIRGGDAAPDEFYWNVNGTGWTQTFDGVSATLRVEPALRSHLSGDLACYAGDEIIERECDIRQATDRSVYASSHRLYGGETLTFAVGFAKDTFTPAPDPRSAWWLQSLPLALAVLALTATIGLGLWRRKRWPDAAGRPFIVPEYTPPPGTDLYTAAEVLGRMGRVFPAVITDLAVRRRIAIVGRHERASRYSLTLTSADAVTPPEREVLGALFGDSVAAGSQRSLGVADTRLRDRLRRVEYRTRERTIEAGLRERVRVPLHRPASWVVLVIDLAAIALFVAAWTLGVMTFWVVLGFCTALGCLIALPAVIHRPARLTKAGAELRDYLLGLRDYITLAETDRIRLLQSPEGAQRSDGDVLRIYERLLPYAVLWNLEKQWAAVLVVHYEQADTSPDWLDVLSDEDVLELALSGVSAVANLALAASASKAGGVVGGLIGGAIGFGIAGGGATTALVVGRRRVLIAGGLLLRVFCQPSDCLSGGAGSFAQLLLHDGSFFLDELFHLMHTLLHARVFPDLRGLRCDLVVRLAARASAQHVTDA